MHITKHQKIDANLNNNFNEGSSDPQSVVFDAILGRISSQLGPVQVALLVASRYALPGYSDRRVSGFEAQAGQIIVSGYSGVCFEITLSGRHIELDGVLFNVSPLANYGFRDAQY